MPRRYRTIDMGDGEKSRHLVVEWNGKEGFIVRFTTTCSGCFESEDGHPVGDYPVDPKHNCYIGSGCDECGYTGKRRHEEWIPFDLSDWPEWDEESEVANA